MLVIEPKIPIKRVLDLASAGEVAPTERHAPMLVEDRALESFDEPVGPGVPRLRARMGDAERAARLVEDATILAPAIGKDAFDRPSCLPVERLDGVPEEGRGLVGRRPGHDARGGERAGGIAGRELPHLADPLELADVEAVETDEVPRMLGFDVAVPAGPLEASPRSFGKEPRPLGTMALQDEQTLAVSAEPHAAESSVDGARCDRAPFPGKPRSELVRTQGRPRQGKSQDRALILHGESRRPSPGRRASSRVHPIGPVALQSPLPAVEERPRDAELAAHGTDIARLLRLAQHKKPKIMYTVLEGHRDTSESLKLQAQNSRKDTPGGPLLVEGSDPGMCEH